MYARPSIRRRFRSFLREVRALSTAEYAVVVAMIAVGLLLGLRAVARDVTTSFTALDDRLGGGSSVLDASQDSPPSAVIHVEFPAETAQALAAEDQKQELPEPITPVSPAPALAG